MPARKSLEHLLCPVANTVELIGDRWTFLILRDAMLGIHRFDEFHEDLGIARNILTDRLRSLVESEIVEKRAYQVNPTRFEYLLTPKGKDLFDVLMTIWRWGDRWARPPVAFPPTARHLDCGHEGIHAVITCSECGEELNRRNVRLVRAPTLALAAP